MKVVLLDDIVNLGDAGSIVEVKDGYARNFLIPRSFAYPATKDALNSIELIRRAGDVKRVRRMEEAAGKFALLANKSLTITMKAGTESRLFGAVTSAMIADEILIQHEVEIERRHIMLDEPIKHLGEFTVPLKASGDVTGEIKLLVVPEGKKREEFEKELVAKVLAKERAEAEANEADAAEGETEASATSPESEEAAAAADVHEKYEDAEEKAPEA